MGARSVISGIDAQFVINRQGRDAVLFAGLLDRAHKEGLQQLTVTLLQAPHEGNQHTAICHARAVFKDGRSFEDIGDANSMNVGKMIAVHITRMAATRAKARALRDALNINGLAVEELGDEQDDAPARPRPVQDAGRPRVVGRPATEEQIEAIRRGCALLREPAPTPAWLDGLTYEQAREWVEEHKADVLVAKSQQGVAQ